MIAIYMAAVSQLPVAAIRQHDVRDLTQAAIVLVFMIVILGQIALDPDRKGN